MKTNILSAGMAVWVPVMMATATLRASADSMATAAKPDKAYTGMVTSVDPKERTLSVKKWALGSKKFSLGDGSTYTLADKGAGAIGDLRPGQRVRVDYQDAHGVLVADSVVQQPMRYDGTVKAIDPTRHTMVLRGHGMDRAFQIANDCRVVLRDDKTGGPGDIQTGNYVTVTYESPNATPTARQIAQTSETFTGSLTAIDLQEKTVKAKGMLETKKFNVGANCAIVVNGKPDGKLSDLNPKEKLTFDYDDINGINVVNRIAPAKNSTKNVVVTEPSAGD
jgi:hypothetical protein